MTGSVGRKTFARADRPEQIAGFTPTAPGWRRVWTLSVGCLGVALVVGSMVAFNTALGAIAVATAATQTQLNWIVDGYSIVLTCLLLPAGAVGDRYGRRGAMLIGLVIFSIASVAPVLFHSPVQIIAFRMVAGAGAALVMPSTLSLISVAYATRDRSRAVGIWAGVAGCGAVIGMLGSGLLLRFADWQSIFWALGGAGAVVFGLACTVQSSRITDAPRIDWLGGGLIGAAIALLVSGLLQAPARGWTSPAILGCLVCSVVIAVVFGLVELRRRQPLLDVRLFGDREFAAAVATITTLFAATFGYFYIGMQYVQQIMGYSALLAAAAFIPFVVPLATLSAASFWYAPKLGMQAVLCSGMTLMAIGFVCMLPLGLKSAYFDVAWPAMLLGTGIGLCTGPATSAIMGAAPGEKQGVAAAINDASRELGAAVGIAVVGSILADRYTRALTGRLPGFPEPVRGPASESLAQATQAARLLGAQGDQLSQLSKAAFIGAMHASTAVMAAVVAVAAVLIGLWAPVQRRQQHRSR